MIGYSLVQGFLSTRVDNAGHVGGLIGGALIALCLPVRLDRASYARKLRRGLAMAAAVAAVLVVGTAALAPRVPQAMRDSLAASRQIERAHKTFTTAFQAMQADNAATKAGRMTPEEADDRSRTVHARRSIRPCRTGPHHAAAGRPARAAGAGHDAAGRPAAEMARMPSVRSRTGKPVAADPRRAAQIAVDIVRLTAQMKSASRNRRFSSPRGSPAYALPSPRHHPAITPPCPAITPLSPSGGFTRNHAAYSARRGTAASAPWR